MKRENGISNVKKKIRVIRFFIISLIFVFIAAAIAIVGCNYFENQSFKETFYCVSSLKVNNKIRLIQISDLHNGAYDNNNHVIIDRVEKLHPDFILLTGDCIDSKSGSEDKIIYFCSELAKIAPTYYIYGNNEVERFYNNPLTQDSLDKIYGFNDENRNPQALLGVSDSFTEKLENEGVRVLKNSFDTITVGATKVDVYGVLTSNPSSFWSYAGASFDEYIYSNENHLKVTAIHEPTIFEEYTPDTWGDLMLAGHTHGGTVRLPILGPVYTPDGGVFPEQSGHYVYGRYDVLGRPLIVNSGMENNTFYRINNQPEIVIVDINKF